jgi:hypothetical protein
MSLLVREAYIGEGRMFQRVFKNDPEALKKYQNYIKVKKVPLYTIFPVYLEKDQTVNFCDHFMKISFYRKEMNILVPENTPALWDLNSKRARRETPYGLDEMIPPEELMKD